MFSEIFGIFSVFIEELITKYLEEIFWQDFSGANPRIFFFEVSLFFLPVFLLEFPVEPLRELFSDFSRIYSENYTNFSRDFTGISPGVSTRNFPKKSSRMFYCFFYSCIPDIFGPLH